jgi:hypothetical protein
MWVMNGPKAMSALSPFDSQLRTLVGAAVGRIRAHKQTHALQQTACLFDHLVGALRWRGAALKLPKLTLGFLDANEIRGDVYGVLRG